ncbi:Protein ltv1 [Exophiala xenobiotica]|uniref:Protein ltv1 n=1 Tax=Lithohypha guttulata TaxID=1690604 RepID=A0ABR0KF42_9EURO|nr:Protein ltv1 [Lithohypha guttulata]KAK5322309.1 Protein ltv1 [Exophiala xenobiotica]
MPRRKFIDKNNPTTQTFQLLYRSQNDPLLNDEHAGDRALFPTGRGKNAPASSSSSSAAENRDRALHLADLEEGDDLDFGSMRDNEGEAAEYGVYFDDTNYDYMQHLRDLNEGGGESYFVDALPTKVNGKKCTKGKQAMRLEEALAQVDLHDEEDSVAPSLVDASSSTFSRTTKKRLLEAQQDVPDEIAGFQPDMDPRLREVLEALEDDAYVDEKGDEDVFAELGLDGQNNGELDLDEFEGEGDMFADDDGWESDATEKAAEQVMQSEMKMQPPSTLSAIDANGEPTTLAAGEQLDQAAAATASAEDGDWLRDFAKYKRDAAASRKAAPVQAGSIAASGLQDRAPSLYTLNGTPLRQKKRKGAQTNPSAYSMTSSSLNRGPGLELLDRRFDQVEKMYSLDEGDEFDDEMDGGASMVSGMTGASKMSKMSKMSALSTASFADPGAVRSDFNGMVDDFLGGWDKANPGGKRKGAKGKRGKNGNEVFGLQQLEEVRKELGPARK